jgi:uncharacterized protein (TIGR02145 family)
MIKTLFTIFPLITFFCFSQSKVKITDSRDGKIYKTVQVGSQIWMAENLNVSTFRNGDTIFEAKTDEEWKNAAEDKKPAWCYYKNKEKNGEKYGKLYNWYAANDSRGLAPDGWYIPSYNEWELLFKNTSKKIRISRLKKNIESSERKKLKIAKVVGSFDENGSFGSSKNYICVKKTCSWWCISDKKIFYLESRKKFKDGNNYRLSNEQGLPVRCIKN